MTVTEIKRITSEKCTVIFDDGSAVKTVLSVVTDFDLYSGRELDNEEYKCFLSASEYSRCKNRAMQAMAARAMSRKELTDKLTRKGESAENSEKVAAWLGTMGLLNDEDYAARVAEHYESKGYGPARIREELFRRGISRELREETLEQTEEDPEKIDQILRKKLRGIDAPDRADIKKAADFLLRRGFSRDEVWLAVRRFNAEIEED